MTLGEYLKIARGDRTLGQLSATSGIDKGYLSKIERDERKPKPEMLGKIAEAYPSYSARTATLEESGVAVFS